MPVSVAMPNQQKPVDPLEKLANAVQIARSIYGIHADATNLDLARQQKAEQTKLTGLTAQNLEDTQKGVVTNKDLVDKGISDISDVAKPGYVPVLIRGPESDTPMQKFVKPKSGSSSALEDMIKALGITKAKQDIAEGERKANDPFNKLNSVEKAVAEDTGKKLSNNLSMNDELNSVLADLQSPNLTESQKIARGKQAAKLINSISLSQPDVVSQPEEARAIGYLSPSITNIAPWNPNPMFKPDVAGFTENLKQIQAGLQNKIQTDKERINQLVGTQTRLTGLPDGVPGGPPPPGVDHSLEDLKAERERRNKAKNATARK